MVKTTLKIDGMMCPMCEAHANDAVRRVCDIKKVSSSHTKGETVVISENELDEQKVRAALDEIGYRVLDYTTEPYEKKKGFLWFGRK